MDFNHDNERRTSKHRRSVSIESGESEAIADAPLRAIVVAGRQVNSCIEWGMPHRNCCSGCVQFADRVGLLIDDRHHDELMTERLKTRDTKYKHRDTQCLRLWSKPEDGLTNREHKRVHSLQQAFIEQRGYNPNRLELFQSPFPTTPHVPRRLESSLETPAAREGTIITPVQDNPVPDPDCTPAKKQRKVNFTECDITSNNKPFHFDIPNSHVLVTSSYLSRLQKQNDRLDSMKQAFGQNRFVTGADPLTKTLLSTALAATPALATKAAAFAFPLIVGAFLNQHGLLPDLEDSTYAQAFPSETYLRNLMIEVAAQNIVSLKEELKGKKVYLSCDKGNKKNVGHFVKYLSWWSDDEERLRVELLDIDASEGTTEDCATAISKSLKKVDGGASGCFLLNGQTTDSGGGGVLDNLARVLQEKGVCVEDPKQYLVAACGIHCLQLQLARPTQELIGVGGTDKRNALQLLHCIYYIQENMDWDVCRSLLDHAQEFHDEWFDKDFIGDGSPGDTAFALKWNKVCLFRTFVALQKQKWKHCAQCVLTRWWYVGLAVEYGWLYYLLLLKFSQSIINLKGTDSSLNMAASTLQSHLIEPLFYSDIALLKCFHDGYFRDNMAWMMESKDLTEQTGFQAHQMAVRTHIMNYQLRCLKDQVDDYNSFFYDFVQSLNIVSDNGPLMNDEAQRIKAYKFIDIALESLDKHFKRWFSDKLLPAALVSERPLADAVARSILGRPIHHIPLPPSPDHHQLMAYDALTLCRPRAHRAIIHVSEFEKYVHEKMLMVAQESNQTSPEFNDAVKTVCEVVLAGTVDLRDTKTKPFHELQNYMWTTYLPLASQSQFVERGVKESAIVSSTDRGEESRSAHAINRSANVHSSGIDRQTGNTKKVEALFGSAMKHVARQQQLITTMTEEGYKAAIEAAKLELKVQSSRKDRTEKLVVDALNKADKNKKTDNVRQRATGVTMTLQTMGLIAYSKLKKKDHTADLETELLHRGYQELRYPMDYEDEKKRNKKKTFTDLKKALKEMEKQQVSASSDSNAISSADRGFQKLSDALFAETTSNQQPTSTADNTQQP